MTDTNQNKDHSEVLKDRDGDGVVDLPPIDGFKPVGIPLEKKRELDRLFSGVSEDED